MNIKSNDTEWIIKTDDEGVWFGVAYNCELTPHEMENQVFIPWEDMPAIAMGLSSVLWERPCRKQGTIV